MSEERDYEAEARAEGWKPESEWTGDEPPKRGFVDAKTFVENGERVGSLLRAKVERLEGQLDQVTATAQEFREYSQQQMRRQQEEAAQKIADLERKAAKAIDEGDGAAWADADRQLQQERANATTAEDPAAAAHNANAQAFLRDNPWYRTDPDMQAYADGIAPQLDAQGLTGQAFFNELARKTNEFFSQRQSTSSTTSPVEQGAASTSTAVKPRSYEALPAADRAQCDRFVSTIPGYTKEQFVAEYDWDE